MENEKNKKGRRTTIMMIGIMWLVTFAIPISGLSLNDLDDVIITPPVYDEQHLTYNLSLNNWTNSNFTGGGDGYAGDIGHPHNQDLNTTSAVTFLTLNTGLGANELYAMNQNVRTTDDVFFETVNTTHLDVYDSTSNNYINVSCGANKNSGFIFKELDVNKYAVFYSLNNFYFSDLSQSHAFLFYTLEKNILLSDNVTVYNNLTVGDEGDGNLTVKNWVDALTYFGDGDNLTFTNYSCRVRLTANQNAPIGTTRLNLNNEDYDYGNRWGLVSYTYKVPEDGLYHISYSVYADGFSDGVFANVGIYVNSVLSGGFEWTTTSSPVFPTPEGFSSSDTLHLNVNDLIDIRINHNNANPVTLLAVTYSNYCCVHKID